MIGVLEPHKFMNLKLSSLSISAIIVFSSCRKVASDPVSEDRPALEIRQQNILPVGEIRVRNLSSYSLEIELNGSRKLLIPNSSNSYSGLKSEIDVYFWMMNRNSPLKVAWCNVHPTIVGTEITIRDPEEAPEVSQ